ncbi:MAG: DNA mismatch repair endonuclease MutL [Puniceicoccales bacterium]|jgi:DNA mismatch repair protein MutL|nr:DNA mismatch repair endonuclease MutL [Puniceicoccales bacterium]
MAKIHLLPETIANQIAAGEVVDRPASIVKELVENSIDAQAKRIVVKFSGGGDTFLSVADDGVGMDAADAAMAFERNATSKLAAMSDLDTLATFGFRGEAIASIASVARVTLQTNDGSGGTEIYCDSGKKIHQKFCGCRRGTLVEIRNLFEKVPARRQFLKSISTEAMHIIRIMRAFILAEPEIYFELHRNGKLLFQSPDSRDLRDRTELLFGHFDQYAPLDCAREEVRLRGILFEPAVDGLVSRPDFLIFVNGRNVNNPALMRVVRDTYAMIKSRVTAVGAFLFLEFRSHFVDFNVHPQKKEVRFRNDLLVKNFVQEAVMDALRKKIVKLCPSAENNMSAEDRGDPGAFSSTISAELLSKSMDFGGFRRGRSAVPELNFLRRSGGQTGSSSPTESRAAERYVPPPQQVFELSLPQNLEHFPSELLEKEDLPWNLVGLFGGGKFAIFEAETGLVFVSLAAAQRCILLNKFLHYPGQFAAQGLLIPRVVTVAPDQAAAIDAALGVMADFGIEIENFGKNIYKITALPREISEEMVLRWLQDPSLESANKVLAREDWAKKFCAHLPFQPVRQEDVKILLGQLFHCPQFMISPDRTNVLFEIDGCDFAKKFGLQSASKGYDP